MRRNPLPYIATGLLLLSYPALLWASDYDPNASFTISPSTGSVESETEFTFDASASVDQRGFSTNLDYRWHVDDGDSYTSWSSSSTYSYTYDSDGDKDIELEVRDEDGNIDSTSSSLTVWESRVFNGWFDVDPYEGDINTVFTFMADLAAKSSVSKDDFQYRWDFNGDGEWDTDYSYSQEATTTFSDTGYYITHLEILDPDGDTLEIIGYDTDDDDHSIYVTFSDYPEASMAVSPTSGSTSTTFYFDGSDSFDSQDHSDIEYRWDLDGDGLFEYDWGDEESPSTKYDTPGDYEPILQVRDTEGNTDEVFVNIEVTGGNLGPEAAFTVNSDSGLSDDSIGTTSTTFSFNAGSSSDEEDRSSDLEVRWDFEGDGDWDTTFDTEKKAENRYLDAGTYTVILEIKDLDGETDTEETTITIVENEAPIPSFSISPASGTPGTTFYVDASDSSDSQYKSTNLEVRWDWEGDGTYDTTFEIDKTTSHQYDEAGTYEVTLQVRDPEGTTATTTQTIEVVSSTAPVASLTVDSAEGTFSTLFHFDASDSYDGESEYEDLYFRWDYDYTGSNDIIYDTSWSRTPTKSKYFDDAEEITIRLEVKDEDDEVGTAYITIELHWASAYLDTLKSKGIIKGYSGDLLPDQKVTRAELVKMVMEATDVSQYGHSFVGYFDDVTNTDWFDSYVEVAYEEELVSGYPDGLFWPNSSVNRAEATKIILTAFGADISDYSSGTFPDVSGTDWFGDYVGTAQELGLLNGHSDGSFHPDWPMTRGEASKVIALAMDGLL
jgi:PKD repeat protein